MSERKKPDIRDKSKGKKFKYIEPPEVLRRKIGSGGIDPVRLERAEKFIDENKADFTPFAQEILRLMHAAAAAARAETNPDKETINKIAEPIMEMKAHGAMFHYRLASDIAGVMLNFIEGLQTLNDDALHILDLHNKAQTIIVTKGMTSAGGAVGEGLIRELHEACRRYEKKYPAPVEEKPEKQG